LASLSAKEILEFHQTSCSSKTSETYFITSLTLADGSYINALMPTTDKILYLLKTSHIQDLILDNLMPLTYWCTCKLPSIAILC